MKIDDSLTKEELKSFKPSGVDVEEAAERVIKLLDEGWPPEEIMGLMKRYGVTYGVANACFKTAYKLIYQHTGQSTREIIGIHYKRYEEIFRENSIVFNNYKDNNGNTQERRIDNAEIDDLSPQERQYLAYKLGIAMESLRYKEEILGMHDKRFKLKMTNSLRYESKDQNYDFTKLSLEERKELMMLIQQAETTEEEAEPAEEDGSYTIKYGGVKYTEEDFQYEEISPFSLMQKDKKSEEKQDKMIDVEALKRKIQQKSEEELERRFNNEE